MVINEVKEAERIIETNKFDKLSSAVALIVRYYVQIQNLDKSDIQDKIEKFLILNHEEYEYWEKSVNKMINKANKYPLCQIDEIPITQKEIDTILQIDSDKRQKILFTFLVIGKLKYLKTGKSWVNDTGFLMFKRANAETKTDDRDYIIRDFHELGLISYPKSPMNMSIHIDFIDPEGEPVFTVKDLRNLGFRWMKHKGLRYIECGNCGILFKPTRMNNCYCKDCRGYVPLKTKIVECCEPNCGISFETPSNTKSKRCPSCRRKHYNDYQKNFMYNKRNNDNS